MRCSCVMTAAYETALMRITQPVAAAPPPSAPIIRPARPGPRIRARLKAAELRPTALVTSSLVDHLGDERLAGRGVEGRADAEDERQQVDVPDLDDAGHGDQAEHQRGAGHHRLGDLEQPALGEAVGDHAGVRREQQHGQELEAGGDAERRAAAAGELEHQPVLGDALHPGAGVADDAAGGVLAVVGVVQRLERGTQGWSVLPREVVEDRGGLPQHGALLGRELGEPAGEPGVAAGAVGAHRGRARGRSG